MLIFYAFKLQYCSFEKTYGICSLMFVVDGFTGLFLQPSVFSINHLRSAEIVNDALLDF